jgi:uncharacterized protein (TIGR04206 family)
LFLLPWSVLSYGGVTEGSTTLLFAWGLFDPATAQVTGIHTYLTYTRGLPDWLLAWPVGAGALVGALASAAVGYARGRDSDSHRGHRQRTERVTASLLALVGVAVLSLSWGFSGQLGRTGFPLGTAVAWAVGGWFWLRHRRAR